MPVYDKDGTGSNDKSGNCHEQVWSNFILHTSPLHYQSFASFYYGWISVSSKAATQRLPGGAKPPFQSMDSNDGLTVPCSFWIADWIKRQTKVYRGAPNTGGVGEDGAWNYSGHMPHIPPHFQSNLWNT